MLIVVMGVSGSGKTTVGTRLADALGCAFLEGDLLHPAANVEKMRQDIPLTDADRAPWIAAVHERMRDAHDRGESLVVACSALKRSYRAVLADGLPVTWVHLTGTDDIIRSRLQQRTGHFATFELLPSQIEALEEPSDAIVADVSRTPDAIVDEVLLALRARRSVRIFDNATEMSSHAAAFIAATIRATVETRGRCSLALSGGSTPRQLHRMLASEPGREIPWPEVHVFWGDERYIPHDDAQSNYRMARETLLAHVPCPAANVHPMPTHFADPDEAARAYEATLSDYFATEWPCFDVVVLGLGSDGHTASLFPGSPALQVRDRCVVPSTAPSEPATRLTLTLPVLTRSAHTHFLVAGADKAAQVRHVQTASADPATSPAAVIQQNRGAVTWWLDAAAAHSSRDTPAADGSADTQRAGRGHAATHKED